MTEKKKYKIGLPMVLFGRALGIQDESNLYETLLH